MSDSVTVPGLPHQPPISETFDNRYNFALAQQIANALAAASASGSLNVVEDPSTIPDPTPGKLNELIITKGGDYTIPGTAPGWVVILDNGGLAGAKALSAIPGPGRRFR